MNRRGISLLEVMITLTVVLTMMAMALASISNAIEMRNLLETRDETTRSARVAMGKLRRELQLAFLTEHRDAIETYQTVFVGEGGSTDVLWFTTLSHQRLYRDSRESDQTEITIWAEPARGDEPGYVLYHREAPRIDEDPDEGGIVMPLAHKVRSFELRYLDPIQDEWVEEWDTRSVDTPNRLPRAVQIGLVLIGQDLEDPDRTVDLPFLTTVVLEYAESYPTPGLPLGQGVGNTATPTNPARSLPQGPRSSTRVPPGLGR